jgi:hypothetical protein
MNNERKEEIEQRLEEIKERLEVLNSDDNEDEYNQFIDECYPDVKIGNFCRSASYVLKECDPIMYNCGLSEFNDEEIGTLETEKEELETELKKVEE